MCTMSVEKWTPPSIPTGYATKSNLALLMHLYSKYTHISANDMAANYKKLRFPYNVEESLTILVERLDECTDLSEAAVNPVTKTQLF